MVNLGLYKNKPTTFILNRLSKTITHLNKNDTKIENTRARSLLSELKSRNLTANQRQQHKRLLDRYAWI